jgi:hypothetical protein
MKLHIVTQIEENYGAHNWDGVGSCPQYWKMKGGNDYMFNLGPAGRSEEALAELVAVLRGQIEEDNQGYREYIVGYGVVSDNFLTDFERSQLDYDGEIAYPARELQLKEAA